MQASCLALRPPPVLRELPKLFLGRALRRLNGSSLRLTIASTHPLPLLNLAKSPALSRSFTPPGPPPNPKKTASVMPKPAAGTEASDPVGQSVSTCATAPIVQDVGSTSGCPSLSGSLSPSSGSQQRSRSSFRHSVHSRSASRSPSQPHSGHRHRSPHATRQAVAAIAARRLPVIASTRGIGQRTLNFGRRRIVNFHLVPLYGSRTTAFLGNCAVFSLGPVFVRL